MESVFAFSEDRYHDRNELSTFEEALDVANGWYGWWD